MPKDNREVLRGFTVVDGDGKQRTITDIDEVAAMFTQPELNEFVSRGLLEGEWTSTKKEGDSELPAGILSLDETMDRFQKFDFSDEVIASLRHHKPALAERFGDQAGQGRIAGKGSTLTDDKTNEKDKTGGQSGSSESDGSDANVQTLFTENDLENDTKADLMTKVEELRKGGFVVEVTDTATKAVIIDAILNAKKAETVE